jgi:hypothetical protein
VKHIVMTDQGGQFASLLPLLQQGVDLPLPAACSIKAFIASAVHPDGDYIDRRIQTVFLNGKAVDDLDGTLVNDGDVLALSAAMPGLVGATFRRSGAYAVFRSAISHTGNAAPVVTKTGFITVKLFNIVASEVGRRLFRNGVRIRLDRLLEALGAIGEEASLTLDGQKLSVDDLAGASDLRTVVRFQMVSP